ncbi:GIY-YIG nuclease family protein [Rhizorhapis suberifaciens]|uniref:Putative endonuclease n=1 Tax=Rhizorhapis suberifaciens TaxID=13656 RepID=A0A840HRD2_9SPHN|nr:GIY-YIG nuclease family protein [Rhizorhapis suberifaciens]MBB4640682.1 putative endonuclease [Rhizorhapis suberifaciens]
MSADFQPTAYIMASHRNGTLYTGVTSNLLKRVHEHRLGLIPGFTTDYGVKRLVYFEQHGTMENAIGREKQIKKWKRQWKIDLIERDNPDWNDLAVTFGFEALPSRRVD